MTPSDCERLRELAPELALGIADGAERAAALEHLASCAACRAHLERLAAVADEMLLLAPGAEPPAGFEQRVVAAGPPATARPQLWRRVALPAATAVAAAAIAAGAVWSAVDDDRELADSYRETLAVANGEYFAAAPLEAAGGAKVGYVYGYQGHEEAASWVFAVVYDGLSDGEYKLAVVTPAGRQTPLRALTIHHGYGSEGTVTPMPYSRIAELRVVGPGGREVARAAIHQR